MFSEMLSPLPEGPSHQADEISRCLSQLRSFTNSPGFVSVPAAARMRECAETTQHFNHLQVFSLHPMPLHLPSIPSMQNVQDTCSWQWNNGFLGGPKGQILPGAGIINIACVCSVLKRVKDTEPN